MEAGRQNSSVARRNFQVRFVAKSIIFPTLFVLGLAVQSNLARFLESLVTKDSVGDKEKVVCLELLGQHLTALSQPWWGEETCLNDFCIYLLSITDFPAGRQGASQPASRGQEGEEETL